ncbi:hypothetical protein ILUMI_12491 [Ignelater luminosus]|uniref:Uncharacterized protein n=1 Tax=Ignelater luminosus TaxID=2038154 RepID=A0A8K0CZH1_IGNLU|nr:hypothetical protein ILUMI_12491 [Ignelater luminosus]
MHDVSELTIFDISTDATNSERIREETAKDTELQELIEELRSTSKDAPFTIDHRILFRDQREKDAHFQTIPDTAVSDVPIPDAPVPNVPAPDAQIPDIPQLRRSRREIKPPSK